MTVSAANPGPRWSVLAAEGKQVVLIGKASSWVVFECETPDIASHIVRELQAWSKGERQDAEFRSLCQAQ